MIKIDTNLNFRKGEVIRRTKETSIDVRLNLDDSSQVKIDTGVGFFDHMLNLMAVHGMMGLCVSADGDLEVDCHHTVEDVGIAIGTAIKEALGSKTGIKRYGTAYVPMDEALAFVSLDLSGRSYLVFEGNFKAETLGNFDTEMVEEFFRAVAFNAGITLHAKVLYGRNTHHMIEGLFKAFGRAICEAVSFDSRIKGVMSTKGKL